MKTIGLCLARVQDEINRKYIDALNKEAAKHDTKIICFHSIYSFIFEDEGSILEEGSKYVFSKIPFHKLSALILMHDSIFDHDLVDQIIEKANKHNIPVINARGINDKCFNICGNFNDTYRIMLETVIRAKKLTDIFYIAGRTQDDQDSVGRIDAFKKALANCGLAFDENKLAYGGYWEGPTDIIMDNLLSDGKRPPQAIFAANDVMAMEVIEKLQAYGFSVPGDCIVTGFDGIESARYSSLGLTTCFEDVASSAKLTIDILEKYYAGEAVPHISYYDYDVSYAGSTGNIANETIKISPYNYKTSRSIEADENTNNHWLDKVIEAPNIGHLQKWMPEILHNGRALIFRTDKFIKGNENSKNDISNVFPENMLWVSKDSHGNYIEKTIKSETALEELIDFLEPGYAGYVSTISFHGMVYGLAFDSYNDVFVNGDCVNRYAITLNRAFLVCASGEKQMKLAHQISQAKYTDMLTGLRNIDGFNKWYSHFYNNRSENTMKLSLGVYTFITYQQVYDSLGVEFVEDFLLYIAHSLELSNPDCMALARISADSFAVINVQGLDDDLAPSIDKAVSMFYGFLEVKKQSLNADVNIEVSCGYTEAVSPWSPNLDYYIDAATSTLYLNRVAFYENFPKNIDLSDSSQVLEFQHRFLALVNNNLFLYHFQPIVDAHTADIVAYEALMRTPQSIGMSPLDVLNAAKIYTKLDKIEWATFSNIFKRILEAPELFKDKHVFINSIPGHFLTANQIEELRNSYSELMDKAVIEITETDSISPEELSSMRNFSGDGNTHIAVDDYGVGHSNIVNLMEYNPHVVKIDRYLITDIHIDTNKQMFVKNLIDFSKQNNIKVLAEGVETSQELQKVVEFGVDYIQGYYTAKPSLEPLQELPENIRNEILNSQSK